MTPPEGFVVRPMFSLQREVEEHGVQWLEKLRLAEHLIRSSRRSLILMYHSVETQPTGYHYTVSVENFAAQMEFLTRFYEVVSLDELFKTRAPGTRRVAITFDDAYADFYSNAFPILQRNNLPATVFVPTGYIECRQTLLRASGFPYEKPHLTWEQMRELQASGLATFGSHSHTHGDAVQSAASFAEDVRRSIETLTEQLGKRPAYFAYPFGVRNANTDRVLAGLGFSRLLCSAAAFIAGKYVEGRLDVYRRNENMPYFKLTLTGAFNDATKALYRRVGGRVRPHPSAV